MIYHVERKTAEPRQVYKFTGLRVYKLKRQQDNVKQAERKPFNGFTFHLSRLAFGISHNLQQVQTLVQACFVGIGNGDGYFADGDGTFLDKINFVDGNNIAAVHP